MKKIFSVFVLLSLQNLCPAQENNLLFSSKGPLNFRANGSVKTIKKKTNDSTFSDGKFFYEKTSGEWIEIKTKARVRGDFRLKNCYFPPLRLKFKKKSIEGTVFQGNKSAKLVLPCRRDGQLNMLVRKEYVCYQLYEIISPFHFKTRLINLQLTETSRRKPQVFDLLSFIVEDNDKVAERNNGKILDLKGLNPATFDDKHSIRNDYFQFMIGNMDWSAVYQHNSNILFAEGKYIPLPYDFDMSGFVNAPYAEANPALGTDNPRERIYRGFCKAKTVMEEIREEFLGKEGALLAVIDQNEKSFSKYDLNDMKSYLNEFFDILKDDSNFNHYILEGCRK